MKAYAVHLILATYLPPFLGFILVLLVYLGFSHESVSILQMAPVAFAYPLSTWSIFLPFGLCSLLLCRLAAVRRAFRLLWWMVGWALFGTLAGTLLVLYSTVGGHDNLGDLLYFEAIGAVVGIMVAPIHRYFWIKLYQPASPTA